MGVPARELVGDGGPVDVHARDAVHGPASEAGALYGAAEQAKNLFAVLNAERTGDVDYEFIGLMSQLMGKVARFSANPYNLDAYQDAKGFIDLMLLRVTEAE